MSPASTVMMILSAGPAARSATVFRTLALPTIWLEGRIA